jgi:cell division protein FtsB
MKVDLGIWDRLARVIILLLIVAAILGVALSYLPLIQQNEQLRKDILTLDSQIAREQQTNRMLTTAIEAHRDPRTVERLARERLNFAKPDETVIRFKPPPKPGLTNAP